METAQPALTVLFKMVIGGLTSILIVLSTASVFSFSVGLSHFLEASSQNCCQLMSRLQSRHLVVNFFTCWGAFSVCNTACRTRFRLLFIAYETELKVLDCA